MDFNTRLRGLVDERVKLEKAIQAEPTGSHKLTNQFDRDYNKLQRSLAQMFGEAGDNTDRTTILLELVRILENKLVYLQNFVVEPTSDSRNLATLVTRFIDEMARSRNPALTPLEATYYRAILALYAGDLATARDRFAAACESEESDEMNDIKYKSYVILGNLSHEEKDYAHAREMHDRSMRYSQDRNVSAQALAFKALNSYALGEADAALALFEESLELFDRDQPFFNSYFYRNALLFCGLIYFERKNYETAEKYYRQVVDHVEPDSYDYFEALCRLGKIFYLTQRFDEAAEAFSSAIETHKITENEYLVDTYFWMAKTQLRQNHLDDARRFLEKVTTSEIRYEKKGQAAELLQRMSA